MVRRDRPAVRRPRLLTPLVAVLRVRTKTTCAGPGLPTRGLVLRRAQLVFAWALTAGAATFALAAPAAADVSEVGGGAFGYSATVSLFGGPAASKGPAPKVDLPSNGSASPVTASDGSGSVAFGPAVIFESGPLQVSTQGTTGANGSVESSASVTGKPGGPGPVLYGELKSSCTAKEGQVSGSASVAGGTVETKLDKETEQVLSTEPVPTNPAPNTEISGTVDTVGDTFRAVFNEQVKSGNGITVNAVHVYLLGPSAVGDLIIGQSRCSAAAGASRAAQPATSTTRAPSQGATTTAPRTSAPTSAPPTSAPAGDNMPNTGMDLAPLVILASAFVMAGAIVLVDDPRRSFRPRQPRGRP